MSVISNFSDDSLPISTYTTRSTDRIGIDALNGMEMLQAIAGALMPKFEEQMEEAKLRCADEEDDASLGEYMALKSVVEQLEKYFKQLPQNSFYRGEIDDLRRRNQTAGYQSLYDRYHTPKRY